jgi:hypothetical protein
MAKFFTLDDGKTYYNADQVMKIAKVNPNVQDTIVTFAGGVNATFPQSTQDVLKAIRAAE